MTAFNSPRRFRFAVLIWTLFVAALSAGAQAPSPPSAPAPDSSNVLEKMQDALVAIAKKARPAVVSIEGVARSSEAPDAGPRAGVRIPPFDNENVRIEVRKAMRDVAGDMKKASRAAEFAQSDAVEKALREAVKELEKTLRDQQAHLPDGARAGMREALKELRRKLRDLAKEAAKEDSRKPLLDAQKELEKAFRAPQIKEERILRIERNSIPAMGSGFLMPGGFVITSAEVAERLRDLSVITADGRRLTVEWTNADSAANVAVLKVADAGDAPTLSWGDSDKVFPGSFALTIGTQGGYAGSVALAMVSGVNRTGRSETRRYDNLIQFQGVIGSGSSGGPALNARGEVIGMVRRGSYGFRAAQSADARNGDRKSHDAAALSLSPFLRTIAAGADDPHSACRADGANGPGRAR